MNHADVDDLLSRLKETQELLQFPGVDGHFERAERLLVSIARHAPSPAVAQAAMNAITLAALRRDPVPVNADANNVDRVLSHLRGRARRVPLQRFLKSARFKAASCRA